MKICIDSGHGGKDTGGSFRGVYEKDIVLLVCYCLRELLIDNGYEVYLTRKLDKDMTLAERVACSNLQKVDIFISIHTNADRDDDKEGQPEAKGEEIWYYKAGKDLAETLKSSVDSISQFKFRGVKQGNFHVLKYTNAPAVLVELGFIDSVQNQEALTDPSSYYRIARCMATGIEKYSRTINGGN